MQDVWLTAVAAITSSVSNAIQLSNFCKTSNVWNPTNAITVKLAILLT